MDVRGKGGDTLQFSVCSGMKKGHDLVFVCICLTATGEQRRDGNISKARHPGSHKPTKCFSFTSGLCRKN